MSHFAGLSDELLNRRVVSGPRDNLIAPRSEVGDFARVGPTLRGGPLPARPAPFTPVSLSDRLEVADALPFTQGPLGTPVSAPAGGFSFAQSLGLTLGLKGVSEGLQTFSALESIKANERLALGRAESALSTERERIQSLAQQSESLEVRGRLQRFDQQQAAFDSAMDTIRQIRRQAPAGGQQRQLFIRDPGTGRLVT